MTELRKKPQAFDQIEEDAVVKYYETREEYMDRMTKEGFKVFLPSPNELFIDIDSEEMYSTFQERLDYLNFAINLRGDKHPTYVEAPSKSGLPRRHIVMTSPDFRKLSVTQKLVLQIFLGSDPVKELLSLFRVIDGDKHPCIFIEKGTIHGSTV